MYMFCSRIFQQYQNRYKDMFGTRNVSVLQKANDFFQQQVL